LLIFFDLVFPVFPIQIHIDFFCTKCPLLLLSLRVESAVGCGWSVSITSSIILLFQICA
jgi:Na+-transporting NADH:ubiquinone oxidoreductase subunit NqrE